MDKQKQIEEMAKMIRADYKEWLDVTGCIPQGTSYYAECLGGARDCAELLYNAGYRKIPENAVVVPDMADKDFYAVEKAEWDKMVQGAKDIIHEREEKVRKETAEKFAERLKQPPYKDFTEEWVADEICKELKEGCK